MVDFDAKFVNTMILDDYNWLIGQAFNYTLGVVMQAAAPVRDQMQVYLQREPGAVAYPIQWTSEKQRRAFFGTKGFGKGIPYRRTHGLSQGYKVIWVRQGTELATLEVQNAAIKVWRYVKGPEQQRFHWNTGWDNDLAAWLYYSEQLWHVVAPAVIEAWQPANVQKMANRNITP